MKSITVRNRQKRFPIASREARKAIAVLLDELLELTAYELSVFFVNEKRMANLNIRYLNHEGPTDIITFDYSTPALVHGELVICPAVATGHSEMYNATLGKELARYVIHGVLHLQGFDDKTPGARKKMKQKENSLLAKLARRFPVDSLCNG